MGVWLQGQVHIFIFFSHFHIVSSKWFAVSQICRRNSEGIICQKNGKGKGPIVLFRHWKIVKTIDPQFQWDSKISYFFEVEYICGARSEAYLIKIHNIRWFCHRGAQENGPLHYIRTKWVRTELKKRFGKKNFLPNERERLCSRREV